jgi:hypothetical protein
MISAKLIDFNSIRKIFRNIYFDYRIFSTTDHARTYLKLLLIIIEHQKGLIVHN